MPFPLFVLINNFDYCQLYVFVTAIQWMKIDDWQTQVFEDIVQINLANLIQFQVINLW